MNIIISRKPIKELLDSKNSDKYIDSLDFILIKTFLTKKDVYDRLACWLNWYAIFSNIPVYLGVLSDEFYYKYNIKPSSSMYTKWDNIPTSAGPSNFDELGKQSLPDEQRLWHHESYVHSIYEFYIKNNNFKHNPFIEIYLDGSGELT